VLGRTPLVSFTDRIAQWFSVAVLVVAGVFALAYSLVDVGEAINRALALVILACPCALALATPLTQSLALRKAAKAGCLVKKAEAFEKLVQIRNAFFDKTGTLTHGELEVYEWWPAPPNGSERAIIHQLEAESSHPVARLLAEHVAAQGMDQAVQVENISEAVGQGVEGTCNGDHYQLKAVNDEVEDEEDGPEPSAHTTVGLYKNDRLQKAVSLSDRVRDTACNAVTRFRRRRVSVHLLTGDAPRPAIAVAAGVGIDAALVYARQSPEEKRDILRRHTRSLMIGDGVNDSVALADAHVSVAVHGSMEASFKAADIYLTEPGLRPLADLLDLSHATIAIIKRNLIFSLFYNTTFGALALLGFVTPLVAAVLMPLSSVTVILSSVIGNRFWRRFNRAEMKKGSGSNTSIQLRPLATGGGDA
jgi:Cu2+-exporting ATPase/Cu+-exporting ATPase